MKKRRRAREITLQALYAAEISGNDTFQIFENSVEQEELPDDVMGFGADLFHKSWKHREALDKEVASVVKNWEFQRIALIDRIILRMALCELMYFDQIPPKVTINEAIDLAKTFSTAKSGRFVNGILDALFQKLRESDRLIKRGRGLVG
jgi:N utilization substance protein B